MLKKPVVLLSSYANLPPLCYTPSQSNTSCCHSVTSATRHTRNYAQHFSHPSASSHSSPQPQPRHGDEANLSWPDPVHPHTSPTPYQILSLRRGEAYSKHRFYALVKLYHPDRCHPESPVQQLPHSVRLERYRMLIAAHTILSDDAKRRAYDLWGQGWAGHHHSPSSHSHSPYEAYTPREWPPGHDPMNNATWEDWEKWYDREYGRDPQKDASRTMHMSNFGFLSVVFALVSLGGIMQGTRANAFSTSVMEHRDKMHKEASMELARSKRAATRSGDREERIRTFVEHRAAVHAGEAAYQRILPEPETCMPDSVRKG